MGCGTGRQRADTHEISAGTSAARRIYVAKSFRLSVIDWLHVARLYIPYILTASLLFAGYQLLPPIPIELHMQLPRTPTEVVEGAAAALAAAKEAGETVKGKGVSGLLADVYELCAPLILRIYGQLLALLLEIQGAWHAYAIIGAALWYGLTAKRPVYLLDFAVYEPPKEWALSRSEIIEVLRRYGCYNEDSLSFMQRLLDRSGTGQATHWPPGTVRMLRPNTPGDVNPGEPGTIALTPDRSMKAARYVAETVLCKCFEDVLAKTGTRAKDVDFLIVNCSLFVPTPSLAAIVARRFKLKATCRSYNLGGMGCSASVISIDLAKQLLQNRGNSIAVVLSTEEITQQMYLGNERALLLQNTLFRVGGAAMLLSNKTMDGFRAKYKLLHTVRVQDNSDLAHGVVYQCEDPEGKRGIELGKEITQVAGRALKDNLTILGPQVLPIREQAKVLVSMARRKVVKAVNGWADLKKIARLPGADATTGRYVVPDAYVPDFKRAIQHFCIHAGGRAVIDGIEANLKLERWHTAPSRATLYHWGNTSSSSIWYELRYCEGEASHSNGKVKDKDSTASAPAAATAANAKNATVTAAAAGSSSAASDPAASSSRSRSRSRSTSRGARQRRGVAAAAAEPEPPSTPKGARRPAVPEAVPTPGGTGATTTTKGPAVVDPDGEAAAAGWRADDKWFLPDYKGRTVQRGERVIQLAFGSGFKCNSAVWLRMR